MEELLDPLTHSKMEQLTQASGSMNNGMGLVFRFGQTVPAMRDSGAKTRLTARASCIMQTAMSMKDNGLTTKPKVLAVIHMLTAHIMRASGMTTNNMVEVSSHGQMVRSTKGLTSRARRRAEDD